MSERRRVSRQKSFLSGCVYFSSRRTPIDCLVRDVSATGARLIFPGPVNLPDQIYLYIPKKDETFSALVHWHRGDEVGIAFGSKAARSRSADAQLVERVEKLEAEIAALKQMLKQLKAGAGRAEAAAGPSTTGNARDQDPESRRAGQAARPVLADHARQGRRVSVHRRPTGDRRRRASRGRRRFRRAMPAGLCQYRHSAEFAGRRFRQRGRVHHLPRAFPGHRKVHGLSAARIPAPVSERRLSAQYPPRRGPAGAGAVPDRSADRRGAVTRVRRGGYCLHRWIARENMLWWRPCCDGRDPCRISSPAPTPCTGAISTPPCRRG